MAVQGKNPDIEDLGAYWYDDSVNKSNGEFDCSGGFDVEKKTDYTLIDGIELYR